uniref:Fibronectin type-III domain-containing protein n=2 Tax=Guillardia theta TaxID=55529 RepID=A0A7S4P9S7_GUITH
MFKRGRKLLRKYWRISKEGPFFRIAQWAFSKFVSLAVMVDKTLFNETLVSPPTNTRVKFTIIQTQSDRIILNWEAQKACRWIENMYELQICKDLNANTDILDAMWEESYRGEECKYDCKDLVQATRYRFRVRIFNSKGTSSWTTGEFETRQEPVQNGGSGPGYIWRQNSQEIQLCLECRADARPKDIVVDCKPLGLCVSDKGMGENKILLAGEFTKPVSHTDIAWILHHDKKDKKNKVLIVLQKQDPTSKQKDHWRSVFKSHPFIDPRFLPHGLIPGKFEVV